MNNKHGISVIICCYNSAQRLPETIEHLALQVVPAHIAWEIILINNASNDSTAETALSEWDKYRLPNVGFKILDEPNPGLSRARKRGVETASYEYIVFCDDDNWLNCYYLENAYSIMEADKEVAALGGRSYPVSDIDLPDWFEECKGGYAVGRQASENGNVSRRKYLWGSGLVFRKSVYQKAFESFPSLLSDRKGKELSSGGDSEICMRFLLLGYKLFYSDKLVFRHYIPQERLTKVYKEKLFRGFEEASKILKIYSKLIDIRAMNRINKTELFIKTFLKFCIEKLFSINRWDVNSEIETAYFISNIRFGKINPNTGLIKSLVNGA